MQVEIRKAIDNLDDESLSRYISIVANNPCLGSLNHAYLFNQGNAQLTVMSENDVLQLGRKTTGIESEIYVPIFKEKPTFARVKVKEVRPYKKQMVGTNCYVRFNQIFGITPSLTSNLEPDRLGHFSFDDGEVYISRIVYEKQYGNQGLINKAILEILSELFLARLNIRNEEYEKLVRHIVLVNQGYAPSMPDIDVTRLKEFLDIEKMVHLSLIPKKCQYFAETVMLDMEEIIMLRAFLKEDRQKTIDLLERLSFDCEDKLLMKQLQQLRQKLLSTNQETFDELYALKEAKKLHTHLGFQGFFNTRKYFMAEE